MELAEEGEHDMVDEYGDDDDQLDGKKPKDQ